MIRIAGIAGLAVLTMGSLIESNAQDFSPSDTARVSAGTYSAAPETNGASTNLRMSKNGRFIVFESTASNIVNTIAVTPGRKHCYFYDRQADSVEIVSLTSSGAELEADCNTPSVSNDGRYVAFASIARVGATVSLCPDDVCHVNQAYDAPSNTSLTPITSGSNIWVRDRLANDTMLISQVTLPVKKQSIDADTLQPLTEANPLGSGRIPVLETVSKRIAALRRPSTSPNSYNPRISADGQYIVYDTDADNLVLAGNATVEYAPLTPGVDYNSTTGVVNSYLTTFFIPSQFYGDSNGVRDVYVRDGASLTNSLVSLSCKFHEPGKCSVQGTADSTDGVVSDDGGIVAFSSATRFLDLDFNSASDIFLVERTSVNGEVSKLVRISNNTGRIVAANGASTKPALSSDGRYVAFQSAATNLVSNDTNSRSDVFLFDRKFNRMILCSAPASGLANQDSTNADITGAGEFVTFQSAATSFGASGGVDNTYLGTVVRGNSGDAVRCTVALVSRGSGTGAASAATGANVGIVPRSTTRNGALVRTRSATVSYQTAATNICTESDTNGVSDIFQTPICTDSERNTDTDSDGTSDCFDQCASDPIAVESDDTDADGVPDCEDGCSSDPQKVGAGLCGCGVPDVDTDSDGSPDCNDGCDNDPAKIAPGGCGCGIPDTDSDGDGTPDCKESTAPGATPTPAATATPTFNLTTFKPAAPRVRRAGSMRVEITFSQVGLPNSSVVSSYDLTGTRISAGVGTARTRSSLRIRRFLGGVVRLRSSGRWRFSARYNGSNGTQSLATDDSRTITVN